MSVSATGPETVFIPRVLNTPSRLVCRFGWNEQTTSAFARETFEKLVLEGGVDQNFDIPLLGKKSCQIGLLALRTRGRLNGLAQFVGVTSLDMESIPSNGIELASFENLRDLFAEWDQKLSEQIFGLTALRSLGCTGYRDRDCVKIGRLVSLEVLGLTQGSLVCLKGLSNCANLNTLSLGYLKNFQDVSGVELMHSLSDISLNNLPKLVGKLKLQALRKLESVYIVDTPLNVDLEGVGTLPHLQKLWLKSKSVNLQWEELLDLPKLRTVGIMNSSSDEEQVSEIADRIGRVVKSIRTVKSRKNTQIQLELE